MADIFDQIRKQIAAVEEEVNGNQDITDIFTPDFMSRNSRFSSIEEFFEESSFDVNTQEDFEAVPETEIDRFTKDNTDFDSWESFKTEAGKQFALEKFKDAGFDVK